MSYSILINTCDKFEDCWNPFFKLFQTYWPNCSGEIYLNTEFKAYAYPGLRINATKACQGKQFKGKYATWSQCLKWALEQINTDIVLYMQEDYFLTAPVKNSVVEYYAQWLSEHPEISCIHLTDQGIPVTSEYGSENLSYGDPNHYSYLSCQASLWHKKDLEKLIREEETAWNFEWWGSRRAQYSGMKFLAINPIWLEQEGPIIPYLFTGVIGGRWIPDVVDLFKKHDIPMDYSRRGFYAREKKSITKRIKSKWSIYRRWKSILEVIRLKYKL